MGDDIQTYDYLIIGGGMANTFLAALGVDRSRRLRGSAISGRNAKHAEISPRKQCCGSVLIGQRQQNEREDENT